MIPPRNILIIRLSSLGDILHTLPAFQSLRRSFPEARIDWIVEEDCSFLVSAIEGVDRVVPLDTRTLRRHPWKWDGWRRAVTAVRSLRSRHYDISLDFQGLLKTGFLSCLSGAKRRIGFPGSMVKERPAHWFYHSSPERPTDALHVTMLNHLLARAAGAQESSGPASLRVDDEAEKEVESRLRVLSLSEFVIVNPGGGWPTKRWRPAKYGRLTDKIRTELGIAVVVTTGPGEEALYREISRHCDPPPPANFRVPFLYLIPLLRRAHLLIGGDTGPLHLACAIGRPVVGIFGPTSPLRNGPWPARDAAVSHVLPCSYCYGRLCPTKNECMDISVDEVFQAVVRTMERTS